MMDFYYWFIHLTIFIGGCWIIILGSEVRMKEITIEMLRGFQEADQKYIKDLEILIQNLNDKE